MKKVYFVSDLHLGAGYRKDARGTEQMVCEWLESIAEDAEAVYLMGDILDYWYEYRTVVPRGYIRFFGTLARLSDSGVRIVWYIGNHDIWLFDYLRNEIGMEVVDGYRTEQIMGKRFFLNHGDGVGHLDRGFRLIRWIFRNKVCQWLYSGIHPRWTVGFAHRWSEHSRKGGGFRHTDDLPSDANLLQFSKEYLATVDPTIDYFVYGHLHIVEDVPLSETCRMIVLGDWISNYTYGVFDGSTFRIERVNANMQNTLPKTSN